MELTAAERWMSAITKVIAVFFLGLMLVQMTYYRGNRPSEDPVLVYERVEYIEHDSGSKALGGSNSSSTVRKWK
jgi:hypothetical protein